MAVNETNAILEILKTYDFEELILAFCLSILVGLLLGILVFILLTWMSRQRASLRITRRSKQASRTKNSNNSLNLGLYRSNGFSRNSDSLGSPVLNLHRQTSIDPADPLGRTPSFQASTFRPLHKNNKTKSDENDDGNKRSSPSNVNMAMDPFDSVPAESFWLGKGSLRGFLPKQTPPPAYDSVIHMFQETST
ncbi:myc target protein 1 homolog [Chanos chanos]|uniref:Myc target protein 1 homolog n=1 Tax=Chanos chanos TaxID=29144 RepID=A0A6J2V1F7_CHACN|nr:myc target protein 1 homolog [Chanos chanos]